MWGSQGNSIFMTEGDYGIALPITISGITLSASDNIAFAIKNVGETVLQKEFSNIQDNTINIELTEEETAKLPIGSYVYSLDWYQDGVFMCNIVPNGYFRVGDKV